MASEARAQSADTPSASADERTLIGLVETDRYCDECGFNLRGQRVFLDGRTRLVLVCCSECGTLHPANHLTTNARGAWFKRLAGVLLLIWMLFLMWLFFVSCAIQVAVQIESADLLELDKPVSNVFELAVEDALPLCTLAFVSFVVPAVGLTLLTVAAHHWKRWGYLIVAVLLPLVPALIVRAVARDEYPDGGLRASPCFLVHMGLQILGGTLGATLGRPFVRLLTTLFVAPRARQALAFLWLADGKAPPALKRAGQGAAH